MNNYVVLGNILDIKVDAIVNAADKYLSGGGGIDKVIHSAAGEELRAYLAGKKLENIGDVIVTPGFKLKAEYVIHTVGPRCYNGKATDSKRYELARCYENCLNAAKANGIKSIAFPCISTGVYKFPQNEAAEIAVKTVNSWLAKENNSIKVFFVCFSKADYRYYTAYTKM